MTNIKGERLININAEADEMYAVEYTAMQTVSIFNHTDDIVTVAMREHPANDGTVSECIKIAAGAFCNNLKIPGCFLYLTPAADGDISVLRTA